MGFVLYKIARECHCADLMAANSCHKIGSTEVCLQRHNVLRRGHAQCAFEMAIEVTLVGKAAIKSHLWDGHALFQILPRPLQTHLYQPSMRRHANEFFELAQAMPRA